jgi:hypothetical protein
MKFSWISRVMDFITRKKHVFIVKSSECDNTKEIIQTVSSTSNANVDVYSNCEDLFLNLNKYKTYYHVGVINQNDKKNTANILTSLVKSINPRIKMVTYTDKNTFKNQFSMS